MRKLGLKNIYSFIFLIILSFLIIIMFFIGIKRVSRFDNNSYTIKADSFIYDKNFQSIDVKNTSKLKQQITGSYYLTMYEDGVPIKYNVGSNVVVYNDNDPKMYIYGVFYQVNANGNIEMIEKENEIIRDGKPYFYKISDRKYLWIDRNFSSDDGTVNAKNYLIIELDKQGNAHLANNDINYNTINPIILKGTQFSFDIAHEKLIVGTEEINLKNIIGSTNMYQDEVDNEEEDTDYYDDYIKTLVERFNNLNNSLIESNNNHINETNKNDAMIDLSRWVSLGTLEVGVNSVKVNYNVFDPNNEYDSIYLIISDGDESKTIQLNKDKNTYLIRELKINHEYTLTFGYKLSPTIDATNTLINDDVVKIKTKKPNYQFYFNKITTDKIYFYLKMDEDYQIEAGNINLYSDSNLIGTKVIDIKKAKEGYIDYFENNNLGYMIEIKLTDLIYNGESINLDISSKYANR